MFKRLVLLFFLSFPLSVTAGIIETVDTHIEGDTGVVEIQFTTPVNYVQHFTGSNGREIRIQIQVVNLPGGYSGVEEDQTFSFRPNPNLPISQVRYEYSIAEGSRISVLLSQAVTARVIRSSDNRTLRVTWPLPKAKTEENKLPTIAKKIAPAIEHYPYTINLVSSKKPLGLPSTDKHPLLKQYYLYKTSFDIQGARWYRLRLGFYRNLDEAKSVLQELRRLYPDAWIDQTYEFDLSRIAAWSSTSPDFYRRKSIPTVVGKLPPVTTTTPETPPPTTEGLNLEALMEEAKLALSQGQYPKSIRLFTKIVTLPDNLYSRDSLEYLGVSRERNKQIAHAVAEYRRYIKQYPTGPDTVRVQQRLNALLTAGRKPVGPLARRDSGFKAQWDVWGSVFQFYRRDVNTTDPNNSVVTNNSLDTDVNLNARRRGEKYNLLTQFSGNYRYNLDDTQESRFRISSLFVDASDRKKTFSARLGRQSGSKGGVLGRFDGVAVEYRIAPKWKLGAVTGYPVVLATQNTVDTSKYFYGMSIDREKIYKDWDANFFAIQQTVDGITDRSAIGAELRYLKPNRSIFTLFDYDVSYNEINTLLFIGNVRLPSNTTVSLIGDYRNSPILTTSNALQGQTVTTIEELLRTNTEEQIRQQAQDRTAKYGSITLTVAHPLKKDLLINGDVSVSKLGGTSLDPGTDYEYSYSAQLVSSNLFRTGDTNIFGLRYYDATTSNTITLNVNSRYPYNKYWLINPRFQMDFRDRTDNTEVITIKPSIRLDYRAKRNIKFEFEGGYEYSDINETAGSRSESSFFLSIGYIADF